MTDADFLASKLAPIETCVAELRRLFSDPATLSGGEDTPRMLELIRGARQRGLDITAEVYPYTASMSQIESVEFDGWEAWPDKKFARYQWRSSGERLMRKSFRCYRKQRGCVTDFSNTEEVVTAVADCAGATPGGPRALDGSQGAPSGWSRCGYCDR